MSQKMKLKDVIFIAIFSVLFFAVMLVAVALLGSTPVTFLFHTRRGCCTLRYHLYVCSCKSTA